MRRLSLTVGVAAALLVSCGGSSSKSPPAATIAADRAAAAAASLQLTDFPAGWTSAPKTDTTGRPSIDGELAKCLGVSARELNHAGPTDVESPDFSDSNHDTVSSAVGYTPDTATATREFARTSSAKTPKCLSPALQTYVAYAAKHPSDPSETLTAGDLFGTPTVVLMSSPTLGDESVAYRITVPVNTKITTVPIYVDVIVVRKGRAAAELDFEAVHTPFPTDQEDHFVGLVVGRMAGT
jgi:hypothetical protein